jgi:hypothetical protein
VQVECAAIVLNYRCSSGPGKWKSIQQRVPISLTACHFGGQRVWFVCPGRYCGRLAAILYCAGELFACRRCYGLAYASQQQTALHRGLEQARKIRMRLGGGADLLEPFPPIWELESRMCGRPQRASCLSRPASVLSGQSGNEPAGQIGRIGRK